jgi:hypothetical protein
MCNYVCGHGIVVYGLLLICSQSVFGIAECRRACVFGYGLLWLED